MKVLILSTAFSGMAQRVLTELDALDHVIVDQHYDLNPDVLITQVENFQPDLIVCPFLTQRIPDEVWSKVPCLIVHPGIEGDKGPSSLDWAISGGEEEWGVTLLQANGNFDDGDIWGTRRFPMRRGSKTSIYKREVTQAAMELVKQAVADFQQNEFTPRKLDYNDPMVRGRDRPLMKQDDRVIQWSEMTTSQVLKRLDAADSRPGVRAIINGYEVNMYSGEAEHNLRGNPGDILAIFKGAFCCATKDGAVWIRQLKCKNCSDLAPIKLPASMVLEKICDSAQLEMTQSVQDASAIEEIKVERKGDTAYLHFNFYNGAFNTRQCMELKSTLITIKQSDVKKIVFMGGEDFFSNGIHLNCIEASDDPAMESWQNINAIDDLVLEMINSPNQITVAAVRNNAGAGGAIMALACDEVIMRRGVVLNPHYKTMGLYGSEYWTYLLPKRVGKDLAAKIIDECQPMSADEAVHIGMADLVFEEDWAIYHQQVEEYCNNINANINVDEYLRNKQKELDAQEAKKPLIEYRNAELVQMKKTFYDPTSSYHALRRAFVYKEKAKKVERPAIAALGARRLINTHF